MALLALHSCKKISPSMKLCKTVLIVLAALICSLRSASPEFDHAFQQAVDKLEAERGSHKPGSPVPGLVEELLSHGSKQDVIEAIAKVWRDPSRKRQWTSVLNLELPLGPQTDRTPIVEAMRVNLPEIYKIGSPSTLLSVTAGYLYDYGTVEDIEKVKGYLPEVRANDPVVARQIETTLTFSEESKKLRDHNQTKDAHLPTTSMQPPLTASDNPLQANQPKINELPKTTTTATQKTDHGWLVWLMIVFVATSGAMWLFLRKSN